MYICEHFSCASSTNLCIHIYVFLLLLSRPRSSTIASTHCTFFFRVLPHVFFLSLNSSLFFLYCFVFKHSNLALTAGSHSASNNSFCFVYLCIPPSCLLKKWYYFWYDSILLRCWYSTVVYSIVLRFLLEFIRRSDFFFNFLHSICLLLISLCR